MIDRQRFGPEHVEAGAGHLSFVDQGDQVLVDEVAAELGDRVKFVKVDVDANPATVRRFGFSSIPTFAVIREGEVVHQFSGARPKASFMAEVKKVLPRES